MSSKNHENVRKVETVTDVTSDSAFHGDNPYDAGFGSRSARDEHAPRSAPRDPQPQTHPAAPKPKK